MNLTSPFFARLLNLLVILSASYYASAQVFYTPLENTTTTINVPSSGFTAITDPGGPGGYDTGCGGIGQPSDVTFNYPDCGCATVITICPDNPTDSLKIDFETANFSVNGTFDVFEVFDNNTATGTPLYTTATSGNNCGGPGLVVATNPSGCITVSLFATTVVNDPGFIGNIIVTAPAANDIAAVSITPDGQATPTLQNAEVTFINAGTTVVDSFSYDWSINGVPQGGGSYVGTLNPTDQTPSIVLGTFTPANGDVISAWSSLPNNAADGNAVNDTISSTLCLAMAGTFTIDAGQPASGTNFQSFTAAVDSMMACGIAGPVVFDVAPGSGPYVETVVIPEVPGASSVNTITFNGNGNTISEAGQVSDEGIVRLDGADWVTLDSLTVISTSSSYGIGLIFINSADNNTITNCTFDMSAVTGSSTTAGGGIAFTNDIDDPYDTGGNCGKNNRIIGNTIIGGYYGIVVAGNADAGDTGTDSNLIQNNVIEDFESYGILVEDAFFTQIVGNDISRLRRTDVTSFYGIELDDNTDGSLVANNLIHNTHTSATSLTSLAYGIYSDGADCDPSRPTVIVNNIVYEFDGNGTAYGLYNLSSDNQLYYHNTISLDFAGSTAGTTRGFYQLTTASGIDLRNNIFSVTRGGSGVKTGIYFGSSTSTITHDNNIINVGGTGSGATHVGYLGSNQTTLADWQAATGQAAFSQAIDPLFTSSTDFTPTSGFVNNTGGVVNVPVDIFGNARNVSAPDPGAIEIAGIPNDAGVVTIDAPAPVTTTTVQNIEVTIQNYGSNVLDSVQVYYAINGGAPNGPFSYTTPIAVGASASGVVLTGAYTPAAGDVVTAWTELPNGVTDGFNPNDSASLGLCIGLAGNYTIDATQPTGGTNFASFQDAIDSMSNCGISGAVVFDVVPGSGPYVEDPTIGAINGASSTNTISFIGHGDTLRFEPPSTDEIIFTLEGASWVILDSLIIESTDDLYGIGIGFMNGANDNIVRNCQILMDSITGTSSLNGGGIVFTDDDGDPYDAGGTPGSRNLVENNFITGAYYGIVVAGSATTGSDGGCDDNQIIGNTIRDFRSYGIIVEDARRTLVKGNDISRPTRTDVTSFYGIEIEDNAEGAIVEGNRIHNPFGGDPSSTSIHYHIYTQADGTDSLPVIVRNNLIYNINGNGTVYSLYNNASDFNFFVNNSVSIDDQTVTSTNDTRAMYMNGSGDSVVFVNNIISATRSGSGERYGLFIDDPANVTANNNVYWINDLGVTGFVGHFDGTDYDSLSNWQANGNGGIYDANAFYRNPRYADADNGDLLPQAPSLNNAAAPLSYVTDDFFGVARPGTPDPGAIEFVPPPDDAGVTAFLSPVAPVAPGAYDVEVVFSNFGGSPLLDVDLYLEIFDGTNTTSVGPIAYSGNVGIAGADTVILTNFNFTPGSYTLTAWTSMPNGVVDANTGNDTLVFDFCTALQAGNYTIDASQPTAGTNYASFSDAAAALQCGILGDIVFTVQYGTGPYNEQVTIDEIPGSGPLATVTFDGQNADSTVLTHDATVQYATFLLNGADYVTITNLTINATDANNGFGVQVTNDANFATITNNKINVSTNFTGTVETGGIVFSSSLTSSSSEGVNGDYALIEGNEISGGEYGIRAEHSGTIFGKGLRIVGNTVRDADDGGIYTDNQDSLIVIGNDVVMENNSFGDAIYLLDAEGYFEVIGNYMRAEDWALYILDGNITGGNGRAKVINNYAISPNDYGIYLNDVDSVDVYHNTAWGEPGIRLNDCIESDVRNNISLSMTDYAYEDDDNDGYVAFDYNIFYTGGSTLIRFNSGTATNYSSLADFLVDVPAFNTNSLEGLPAFVNAPVDLHRLGTFGSDNGDNTVGVTVDYDGDARPQAPSTTVDIGADEYTPDPNDIGTVEILSPPVSGCGDSLTDVSVVIFNNGTASQSGFDVTADITGTITTSLTATYSGTLAPSATDTISVGTINTYAGATFDITAYTQLSTDGSSANDTATVTGYSILPIPAAPIGISDTGCVGESLTLSVDTAGTGFVNVNWYDAPGGSLVATGVEFNTPALVSSTTYYAEGQTGLKDRMGRPAPAVGFTPPSSGNTFITNTDGWGVNITLFTDVSLDSVTVYPDGGSGTLEVEIFDKNNGNQLVYTSPVVNIASGQFGPLQIPLGVTLPAGFYNVGLEFTGSFSLIRESGAGGFPYVASTGVAEVTEGALGFTSPSTTTGYWFYDFVIGLPGCASPLTEVEAVLSEPVADAGANDTICIGETGSLTAVNGVSWEWSNGETTQSISDNPTSTTTYSLTVTDQYGCESTPDDATIVVNPLPNATAGADQTICIGSTATLTASGGTDYVWSTTETTASIGVTPTTDSTYSVTVTDANGCSATDNVTVSLLSLPTDNAPEDTSICLGTSATLTASDGIIYLWSTGANVPSVSVGPTATTTYTVTVTDANGCVGVDSVTVSVQSVTNVTIDVAFDTVCIDDAPISLVGTPAGGVFTGVGVTNGQFIPADVGFGSYAIRYTLADNLGCAGSAVDNIVVTPNNCITTGIGDVSFIADLGVYPNPFNNELNIDLTTDQTGDVEIRLLNVVGQEIVKINERMTAGNNNYTLDVGADLADGFYVVELKSGAETAQVRVLKAQ